MIKIKSQQTFFSRSKCICGHLLYKFNVFPSAGCEWLDGDFFTAKDTSDLITWQDGRCSNDFLSSLPKPDSHISVATGFGCATIFWFTKNRLECKDDKNK